MEAITLDEAVQRVEEQPNDRPGLGGDSARGSLLQQARAATLPNLNAAFTNVVVDTERRFDDIVTTPRSQTTLSANLAMPIRPHPDGPPRHRRAIRWRLRTSPRRMCAGRSPSRLRRRTRDHRVEASGRGASAHARRHWHTSTMPAGVSKRAPARGSTSCAQDGSASSEARLEVTQLAGAHRTGSPWRLDRRTGPVDAPPNRRSTSRRASMPRPDGWRSVPISGCLRRPNARRIACGRTARKTGFHRHRVVRSAGARPREHLQFWPKLAVCRLLLAAGVRRRISAGTKAASRVCTERLAARADRTADSGAIGSAIGAGEVRSTERALAQLRSAAEQANEVLKITTFAFEAGATANLEVVDARRQARDEDSAAAVAQDVVQRARLDLLTALGRFPQ